jgi:hypothetical protein
MKINQLIKEVSPEHEEHMLGVRWSEQDQDILNWLREKGFKKLGEGLYAQAFTHPKYPGKIVKVVNVSDECFLKYLRIMIKNQGNPHVPKYYGAKQIPLRAWQSDRRRKSKERLLPRRRFFVIMERLSPLRTHKSELIKWSNYLSLDREGILNLIGLSLLVFGSLSYAKEHLSNSVYSYSFAGRKYQYRNQFIETFSSEEKLTQFINNEFKPALENGDTPMLNIIKNILSIKDCDIDFHMGNVMLRPSDRMLVITDPLS